jgi:hypothetical protein
VKKRRRLLANEVPFWKVLLMVILPVLVAIRTARFGEGVAIMLGICTGIMIDIAIAISEHVLLALSQEAIKRRRFEAWRQAFMEDMRVRDEVARTSMDGRKQPQVTEAEAAALSNAFQRER